MVAPCHHGGVQSFGLTMVKGAGACASWHVSSGSIIAVHASPELSLHIPLRAQHMPDSANGEGWKLLKQI